MKTISELNEKWWYRALKVAYLFFTISCYLIAILSIGGYIYAIYENQQWYADRLEGYEYQKSLYTQTPDDSIEIKDENTGSFRTFKLAHSEPIKPSKPNTILWIVGLIVIIPLSLFCAWILTKIPRWIFYYVVLGSINPKK